MITAQERIRLLSDTELYPQATQLMRGVARTLPTTQINGLLNVTLYSTYDNLTKFIEHQRKRTTWRREDGHIPDFYFRLTRKLQELEAKALDISRKSAGQPDLEDFPTLKMLLAREFIQHLLAENNYMLAERAIQNEEQRTMPPKAANQGRNPGPVRQHGRP